MATKTITIDIEAYKRLKSAQAGNESFSQVIKRVVRAPLDIKAFQRHLSENPFTAKAIKAVEKHVSQRHMPSKRSR